MTAPKLLTPSEAADKFQISELTLRKWRLMGGGPRYVRLGSGKRSLVRYRESDLNEWVEGHVQEAVYTEPTNNAKTRRAPAVKRGGRHE